MRFSLLFLILILFTNCSKPKTVLICGDHVCVNQTEAKQYFEENLTIEVKIIDKKEKKEVNLIELNLNTSSDSSRKISLKEKDSTKEKLRILNNEQIKLIKRNIKIKKKNKSKRVVSKKKDVEIKKKNISKNRKLAKKNDIIKKDKLINKSNTIINKKIQIADICTFINKCSIEEISKYLLKQGKKRNFPDITIRE